MGKRCKQKNINDSLKDSGLFVVNIWCIFVN